MADKDPSRLSSPAPRQRWSWVQFWCGLAVAALGGFLNLDLAFDSLPAHLLKTFIFALVFACLAGRYGDPVWLWLAGLVSC
jgi:hypothetical protein